MNNMKQWWKVILIALACSSSVFAEELTPAETNKFHPADAHLSSWVFSGIFTSESGEEYGYYFQLQRDNTHFHANVALMDQASKTILFQENSEAVIEDAAAYDWHVGRSFLRFNPVNASWIFGVKPKDNLGFNFKVDMLKQFKVTPSRRHHLRTGVMMMVSRTSELNGHVLTGASGSEQFVTAKESWFRQIWQDAADTQSHDLSSVLCQFNDGSRFYSVNLQELDAQSGAIAGWYKPDGNRQSMSQFIQVNQGKEGAWHIKSQSPRLDLVMKNAIEQESVVAGFVDGTKNPGFCMLTQSTPQLDSVLPHIG